MRGQGGKDKFRFRLGVAQVVHKKHSSVREQVAMDERADVEVLREEDSALGSGFGQQSFVTRIDRAFACVDHIVTSGPQRTHGQRDDVGVRQDPHSIRRRS
jgi:hypothetical protein